MPVLDDTSPGKVNCMGRLEGEGKAATVAGWGSGIRSSESGSGGAVFVSSCLTGRGIAVDSRRSERDATCHEAPRDR